MNPPKAYIALTLASLALLSAILSCNYDQKETKTTSMSQFYSIQPKSLLEALAQGKTQVFSPVDEQPEQVPPSQQMPVNWNQEDYLRIAEAVSEQAWGENLEGWQLNDVDFDLSCTQLEDGFQNGRFEFFKVVKSAERESRIARFIDIDPRSSFVYVTETEYSPKLDDWKQIDLSRIQFSADDAVRIAENNGGEEKRASVENACDISLWLSPDSPRNRGWEVSYTRSDEHSSLLYLRVDPITGEVSFP